MAQPKVIIMAMNKAKRMPMSDDDEDEKEEVAEEAKETKRLIKIFKNELGFNSQKIGNGDLVEFRIMGKVSSKNEEDLDVEIANASILEKNEKKAIVTPPVIAPSA